MAVRSALHPCDVKAVVSIPSQLERDGRIAGRVKGEPGNHQKSIEKRRERDKDVNVLPFLSSAYLNKGRREGESEGTGGFIKRVERKGWRHEGYCKRVWQKSPGRAVREGFKRGVYERKHAVLLREACPRLRLSFSSLRNGRSGWKNEGADELPKRSAKGWGSLSSREVQE